jgi:hypothetical protein
MTKGISDVLFLNSQHSNMKLVYCKDSIENKLMWYVAKFRSDFYFQSPCINDYSKTIEKDQKLNISNMIKKI